MKSSYGIILYSNYEIKFLIYKIYKEKYFLQYEKLIDKIDLSAIINDFERDKLGKKLKNEVENGKKFVKDHDLKIFAIFDSPEYYHSEKIYTFEYENIHIVSELDIQKIITHAMSEEKVEEGYKAIGFNINQYVVDNVKTVNNLIGMEVNSITVIGDIVVSDSNSYYDFINLIVANEIAIIDLYIGGYLLQTGLSLDVNSGFMEIGTDVINFIFNDNNSIKQTTVKVGFKKLLEDMYVLLLEKYPPETSEDIVRFLMEYFPLKKYPLNATIFNDVRINDVIEEFKSLIINYFNYIIAEMIKQGINCETMYVLLQEYPQEEFIEILNETENQIYFTSIKLLETKNIKKENLKAHFLMNRLCSVRGTYE